MCCDNIKKEEVYTNGWLKKTIGEGVNFEN
ncbi:MAG: hypothetical protein JWM14_732 [Chitinophagaceae bacterium]|nr:hypothetical protein [Chitinophagaceae bacterium]